MFSAVRLFKFSFVRNCEFVTPFRAAACQHFAAIGSLHALAETMYRFAAAVVRLECTFHDNYFTKPTILFSTFQAAGTILHLVKGQQK